ncbi:hypothetical protein LSAT2_014041 [Lamellibrachia satsuma]|nr:hypothetical protein LSAT2_014041 [Lamellibrachia satsuma]
MTGFGQSINMVYGNMTMRSKIDWLKDPSLKQNITQRSFEFPLDKNILTKHTSYLNMAILITCALGLPGNLLLIAVYVRKMTTSTRVYMFALAVADSAVCVCGIVLTTSLSLFIPRGVTFYVFDTMISFSMFLLVFVSIQRLMAVRRPHSFNVKAQRAMIVLVIIAAISVAHTTVATVAQILMYRQFTHVFLWGTICVCVLIMITCYSLVVASIVKRARISSNRIGVLNVMVLSEPGPCTSVSCIATEMSRMQNGVSIISGSSTSTDMVGTNQTGATQTKTYKNILLLLVITFVFIACWLPHWLTGLGISVPEELRRIFILNSVVNPFIYGVASAMFQQDLHQFYGQTRVTLSGCFH